MLSATCAQGPEAETLRGRNLPAQSRLVVANTLGVLYENVLVDNQTGIITISTANYANGIYIAQIKTPDSSLLKTKFVILK